MRGPDRPGDDAVSAISALTSAFEHALAVIQNMDDHEAAFHRATELWAELRKAMDTNGQVRAVLAAQVANANLHLTIETIAQMLSTPAHPVRKARVSELVIAGRAILESDSA